MSNSERDYYCNYKFKYLKIDLESKTTYNCHAARPHPIDFQWLGDNPGQLFNTQTNVLERKQMLVNERNASCEQNCWQAEDAGAVSPRIQQKGYNKTLHDPVSSPQIIDLTIGADCNLTCSYCCKEFSTAWRRDVVHNGDYPVGIVDDRYRADSKDRVLLNVNQPELKSTQHYQLLLDEIKHSANNLETLIVTGGEPLLDNKLIDILLGLDLPDTAVIDMYTGLGVSKSRFENMIDKLKTLPNLQLIVSAEGIGPHLEFNRYGISWPEFADKINLLTQSGIKIKFQSQISNLTVFGFADFVKHFGQHAIDLTFVYQPQMMSPYVLDDATKDYLEHALSALPAHMRDPIVTSMRQRPTETQRVNIKEFVTEFVRRRPDLNMDIFPETFINWLELQHVVQ